MKKPIARLVRKIIKEIELTHIENERRVRAHSWVAGQVPRWGCARGNHTLTFLSLSSPSLPLSLEIHKLNL